jgi:hypothetical protein
MRWGVSGENVPISTCVSDYNCGTNDIEIKSSIDLKFGKEKIYKIIHFLNCDSEYEFKRMWMSHYEE